MTPTKVKFLMTAEVDVDPADPHPVSAAMNKVDEFREAVESYAKYGVLLYRAQRDDVIQLARHHMPMLAPAVVVYGDAAQ